MSTFVRVSKISNNELINGAADFARVKILPKVSPRVMAALRGARYKMLATAHERQVWRDRIDLVLSCPDNAYIRRVTAAGRIHRGYQVMHNGVKVLAGGY